MFSGKDCFDVIGKYHNSTIYSKMIPKWRIIYLPMSVRDALFLFNLLVCRVIHILTDISINKICFLVTKFNSYRWLVRTYQN